MEDPVIFINGNRGVKTQGFQRVQVKIQGFDPFGKFLPGPDDAQAPVHDFRDISLNIDRRIQASAVFQRIQPALLLFDEGGKHPRPILFKGGAAFVNGLRRRPSRIHGRHQGISAETVGSMIFGRGLSHCVKPVDIRAVLPVHPDPAHEKMDGRGHGNRLRGNIQPQIIPAQQAHLVQAFADQLFRQEGDVQIYLGGTQIHFPGDDVARHQVPAASVFFFHKINAPVPVQIVEASALAPCGFRDQHALVVRLDGGGVILQKFQIAQ